MDLTALLLIANWAGWPAAALLPLAFAPLGLVVYVTFWLKHVEVPEL